MSSSSPSPELPTIILIPGACLSASIFTPFIPLLTSHNYPVQTLQVPSADPSDPTAHTALSDSASLHSSLLTLLSPPNKPKDLILVAHSYAGIPTSAAAVGLSKTERAREGKKGGVIGIVYMAAMVLPAGRDVAGWLDPEDQVGGGASEFDVPSQGLTSLSTPAIPTHLLNDLLPSDSDSTALSTAIHQLLSNSVPHSIPSLSSPAPDPQAWQSPLFKNRLGYIKCTLDKIIPPAAQEGMIVRGSEMMKEHVGGEEGEGDRRGDWFSVREMKAGHCPFLSRPEETAGVLRGFAEEFMRVE